jgi:ABC-type antimicrobial peptide transport system permease subunit
MLFGLDGTDVATLAAAVLLLSAAGLLSAAWPAHRAARIDPMSALRES